ncbi:MAG TPA: hypothetical protein VE465_19250 [Streptosporangiaceae bacterium]|nr:hypothetical protein [Streptosporangiaceae bacterium]
MSSRRHRFHALREHGYNRAEFDIWAVRTSGGYVCEVRERLTPGDHRDRVIFFCG